MIFIFALNTIKMEPHTMSLIYDRLNQQPHLQELISEQVWKLFEIEDKNIWKSKYKYNKDLLNIELKLFIECEIEFNENELDLSDSSTNIVLNIIKYINKPGEKISPIGYDCINFHNTNTIMNLSDCNRKKIIMDLEEEDRLHCFY